MSPRAAWRLERLGFTRVYDYAAGKVDWLASGRPTERAEGGERRAIDAIDPDPSSCSPDTLVGELDSQPVIVVNEGGIVLGRVRDRMTPDQTAEAVMEPGPATVRAHEPLDELLRRMEARHVGEMIVTTPEGRLLGVVRRPPAS